MCTLTRNDRTGCLPPRGGRSSIELLHGHATLDIACPADASLRTALPGECEGWTSFRPDSVCDERRSGSPYHRNHSARTAGTECPPHGCEMNVQVPGVFAPSEHGTYFVWRDTDMNLQARRSRWSTAGRCSVGRRALRLWHCRLQSIAIYYPCTDTFNVQILSLKRTQLEFPPCPFKGLSITPHETGGT